MKITWFDTTVTDLIYRGSLSDDISEDIDFYVGPAYELFQAEFNLLKTTGLSENIDKVVIVSKNRLRVNTIHINNTKKHFWFYGWDKCNSNDIDRQIFHILNELIEER